ncbi:MAG: site-2 protease family protein [Candidatus Dormibacteria bacterium]
MHADGLPRAHAAGAGARGSALRSAGLTVAGFPVTVHPSFFILAALLGGQDQGGGGARPIILIVAWVAVVFVSVLIHELGHATVFSAFGVGARIELYSMGGLTRPDRDGGLSPLRLLAVSIAGPASGLALGLLLLAAARATGIGGGDGIAAEVTRDLVYVNIVWSLVNLLPILPLDGGHVMHHILDLLTRRDTELLAQGISLATVVGLATWTLSRGLWFTSAIIAGFYAMGAAAYWQRRLFRHEQPLREEVSQGWESLRDGDPSAAKAIARHVLKTARSRFVRAEAARLLALAGVTTGEPEVAEEGLARMPRRVPPDPYLEGVVALVADRNREAVRLLTDAFAAAPDDRAGAPLAQALIRAGQPEEAIALVTGPQAPGLGRSTHLALVAALHAGGHFRAAAERGEEAYERWSEATVAYDTACNWARGGHPERGAEWLVRAAEGGFTDAEHMRADPDLASLRGLPGYGRALELAAGRARWR